MPKRTFIGVTFFRGTAGDGALPDYLPAVEVNPEFSVIKLGRTQFYQVPVFIELGDKVY